MVRYEPVEGEGEGADCGDYYGEMSVGKGAWVGNVGGGMVTSKSDGAIDVVPPTAVDAGISNEDEKTDPEE